ncbi:MAG: tetratricopeptide repeat protein [bacterium]|nr:tetratricopeptide repeat protein [bacterium]
MCVSFFNDAPHLEMLQTLINNTLHFLPKIEPDEYGEDNEFYWRRRTLSQSVSPDMEETVAGYYERGEYKQLQTLCRMLTECFSDYPEGYNYLGLVALERENYAEAERHFKQCVDVANRNMPRGLKRGDYWNLTETRPYVRGLRNLVITYNLGHRFEQAIETAQILKKKCDDTISAAGLLAPVYLNTGQWKKALNSARYVCQIYPSEGYLAALALMELDRTDESRVYFLYGLLNNPWAAEYLLKGTMAEPQNYENARNYNTAIEIKQSLAPYLERKRPSDFLLFETIMEEDSVKEIQDEIADLQSRRDKKNGNQEENRNSFRRIQHCQSLDFARKFFNHKRKT